MQEVKNYKNTQKPALHHAGPHEGTHTRLHAHTHTHGKQQASSHLPDSQNKSTNALKTTSTQASEPFSHRMHTNAVIKVQHQSRESIPNHQSSCIGRIQANVLRTKKPFKPGETETASNART